MVLLFTHQNSQRVHYIFNEVIGVRLGVTFQITTDWSTFIESKTKIKISYTDIEPLRGNTQECIWIYNSGFLCEDFIRDESNRISFDVLQFNCQTNTDDNFALPFDHFEALFLSPSAQKSSDSTTEKTDFSKNYIPFDVFSEIFWCISRYEEYQWEIAHQKSHASTHSHTAKNHSTSIILPPDAHGRYPAKQSLMYRNGWIDSPIVDKLIWLLGYCINKKPLDQFEIIPTADIDMALRFDGRSWGIKIGSFIRDFFLHPILILERLKNITRKIDPYQMDRETLPILTQFNNFKVFILHHRKRSGRNKQVNTETLKKELKRLKLIYQTPSENWGIHPSWQEVSHKLHASKEWKWEMTFMENNLGMTISHSRLHYIHLKLPSSYQILEQLGITHDWSMGYPEITGFRAGTSKPFLWYDLTSEKSTQLTIHPFCIMDVTCKNYLDLSSFQSIDIAINIKQTLQQIGGSFCFIFHNEGVSETYPWTGWKNTILRWAESPDKKTI